MLFSPNSELRTPNCAGTVLVLVIAMLAMLALVATTFLVTSRYDQIGTEGFVIENQAEMLLGVLREYVQRTLTDDGWNYGDPTIAGDADVEKYDAMDAAHPWLNGRCGEAVTWDKVLADGGGWRYLGAGDPQSSSAAATLPGELTARYCFLIQDCNGLVNLNCARYPGYRTLWDASADRGHPEWGYWARDPLPSGSAGVAEADVDGYVRGRGPLSQANLQRLVTASGSGESVDAIDAFFTNSDSAYRRYFDIQSEIELRFPGDAAEGSTFLAPHERVLPGTFASSANIRRFVTAIASDGQWWPLRQPLPWPPHDGTTAWEQKRYWLVLNENWHLSADINDHYYGWLFWHRLPLNPGFFLTGRDSAGEVLDWSTYNKDGYGRMATYEGLDVNEPRNKWLFYWTTVPGCHKEGTLDYHEWHADWTGRHWMEGMLINFLTAGGVLAPEADLATRSRAATQFAANYMDAVDPGDHNIIFTKGSYDIGKGASWDARVMGVEREPLISEVCIEFAGAPGAATVKNVAVELVNPYDTELVLFDKARAWLSGGWLPSYRGRVYAMGFGQYTGAPANDVVHIPVPNYITNYSAMAKLAIPPKSAVVILSDTAGKFGLVAGPQVWDTTYINQASRLKSIRQDTGRIEVYRDAYINTTPWGQAWILDRVANRYGDGVNQGIADAFAAYTDTAAPVVRLYRPGLREGRAFQSLATGTWATLKANLAVRNAAAADPQVQDRAPVLAVPNRAFRTAGELGRMSRFGRPHSQVDPDGATISERTEQVMARACSDIGVLPGSHGIDNPQVRRVLAAAEGKLRYDPFAPVETPEDRQRGALLFDLFTVTGCAFDNVDSNLDGRVDEHVRCGSYYGGLNYRPGWLHEIGNTFPTVGRINVNTAPREVLTCLNVPDVAVNGGPLAERLADNIIANRPYKSMQDLLARCRTQFSGNTITAVGFDYFGCDGLDNHAATAAYRIDGWEDPLGLIDDADETQHLYALNSELLSVRSDTFAVYVRMQVLGGNKVKAERRVFSIWDRSASHHPQLRRHADGSVRPNADYTAPRCLATQTFGQ